MRETEAGSIALNSVHVKFNVGLNVTKSGQGREDNHTIEKKRRGKINRTVTFNNYR